MNFERCAVLVGVAVGVTIAAPIVATIACAVGVASTPFLLVGGVPYLIYRNSQKNRAEEAVDRISQILSDDEARLKANPNRLIDGHTSYMNPESKFYSQKDLTELKDSLKKVSQALLSTTQKNDASQKSAYAKADFNRTKLWVSSIAVLIIPVIGFLLAVYLHKQPGGSLSSAREPDSRITQHNKLLKLEQEALNKHITATELAIQTNNEKKNLQRVGDKMKCPADILNLTAMFLHSAPPKIKTMPAAPADENPTPPS